MEIAYEQFRDQSEKEIRALQEEIQIWNLTLTQNTYTHHMTVWWRRMIILVKTKQIGPNMELVRIYDVKSAVLVGSGM